MYYITIADFESFSGTKLFFDQGFSVINEQFKKLIHAIIYFLKNETKYPEPEKNIRIAKSDKLLGEHSQASESITVDSVEGPTVIETPKGWIVYCDEYTRKKTGAVLFKGLE